VPLVFGDGAEEHPALKDSGALNPLTALISAESMQQAGKELTALESQVLGLRLNGRSYRDIAASTGLSEKSIDNALQRAKHKIDQ
jgi:RNA polymerase sporulation-specific sigma factor